MPKRIVNSTIVLVRDKKRVTPAIGKAFEFTAKELEQIEKVNKEAVSKLPEPVDDSTDTKKAAETNKASDAKPGTGVAAKDAKSAKAGGKDDEL